MNRIDKMEKNTLTNNYENYQYKRNANTTSYEMIDWSQHIIINWIVAVQHLVFMQL